MTDLKFHWRLNGTELPSHLQMPGQRQVDVDIWSKQYPTSFSDNQLRNELFELPDRSPDKTYDEAEQETDRIFVSELRLDTKRYPLGQLECWAENFVGHQEEPCVHHLIAAGQNITDFVEKCCCI